MSTAAKPVRTPPNLDMGKSVQIKQLLKDRAALWDEFNTKTHLDTPRAMTALPDGTVIIAMESGRVWRCHSDGAWQSFGWGPLPDSAARETFDQIQSTTRELKKLGYEEED